jgi:hypothetical protein
MGLDRGAVRGHPGRPAHRIPFAPQVQQVGYFAGNPMIPEQPYLQPQIPQFQHNLGVQQGDYGAVPAQPEQGGEVRGVKPGRLELLEERMERSEKQRNLEKARWAITSENRRMQASISPTEHPGLYSQIDQHAAIHDCPSSHRGIMALTGACRVVIKNVDIKDSYLGDAEWEYGWRLCAEKGENLTDEQVLEIEAKVLEFHARQMVEAKKAKDKMRGTSGATNREGTREIREGYDGRILVGIGVDLEVQSVNPCKFDCRTRQT